MRRRFARGEEEPSRPTRPRHLQSTRQIELLSVAARLFRERGYHATTMNEIGAAAGVSGPAIYRHFKSKDDLLQAAMYALSRRVASEVAGALSAAGAASIERLEALVRAYVQVVVEERDLACVYLFETRHVREDMLREFREIESAFQKQWSEILREVRPELDPESATTLIRAASFLVGSVTIQEPVLGAEPLHATLVSAVMNALTGADAAPAPEVSER